MTEEERAALHRSQSANRLRYRDANEKRLAGDTARRKQLEEAWEPLRLASVEAELVEDDCDPLEAA